MSKTPRVLRMIASQAVGMSGTQLAPELGIGLGKSQRTCSCRCWPRTISSCTDPTGGEECASGFLSSSGSQDAVLDFFANGSHSRQLLACGVVKRLLLLLLAG